jgi:Tfp pilus assembly protein PilF
LCKQALDEWRRAGAPRADEGPLVSLYGKCLEAQHKYEAAYEVYTQALDPLTGDSYNDLYTSFLYLNERMGTFTKKEKDNYGFE